MFDNEAKYMTYIGMRQRPLMFAKDISNVKKVIEANQGYKRDMAVWKRTDQTMNFVYMDKVDIDEIDDINNFINYLENE